MTNNRRWVQHLIDEERFAALWMLIVAIAAITIATLAGAESVEHALHVSVPGVGLDLQELVSEGLLVTFFFVAGLELRHELTIGSLNSPRAAAVPVVAAAMGMLVPALLFLGVAPSSARGAWGVAMATDLPLALALLAISGRGLPSAFRAFILSLAIVDDALSILVVAIAFGSHLSPGWLFAVGALLALYSYVQRASGFGAFLIAMTAWAAMLQTGLHPTVLGVALGLATTRDIDGLRERWQPFVAVIAVPAFIAVSLAIPIAGEDAQPGLIAALSAARMLGKPLGIALGAAIAIRFFRPAERLTLASYAAAGSVAALGFSVSILFAELSLGDQLLASTKVAILVALGLSALVGAIVLQPLRRTALHG